MAPPARISHVLENHAPAHCAKPSLWERVARMSQAKFEPGEGYFRVANPSSGADFVRTTFSRKGSRKRAPSQCRGHAAAIASMSQLAIKSVPPAGAANANRP